MANRLRWVLGSRDWASTFKKSNYACSVSLSTRQVIPMTYHWISEVCMAISMWWSTQLRSWGQEPMAMWWRQHWTESLVLLKSFIESSWTPRILDSLTSSPDSNRSVRSCETWNIPTLFNSWVWSKTPAPGSPFSWWSWWTTVWHTFWRPHQLTYPTMSKSTSPTT